MAQWVGVRALHVATSGSLLALHSFMLRIFIISPDFYSLSLGLKSFFIHLFLGNIVYSFLNLNLILLK